MTSPALSTTPAPKSLWVVTSGAAGMVNQGLGLAEALARRLPGLAIEQKNVRLKQPWGTLTPFLRYPALSVLTKDSDPLTAPWPDAIIGVGRQSIAPALACRATNPATTLIQLQRPTAWSSQFDVVIPPVHDHVAKRANVIESIGALHRVTPARLAQEQPAFAASLVRLKTPRYAVLIGGNSKTHQLTETALTRLISDLKDLVGSSDCSLMISTSRRTGQEAEQRLRQAFDREPHWFWDGTAPNPYFAFLAAADAIILTNDSVSMISEASATGKPIYLFDLPGGSQKFDRFHRAMEEHGLTEPLPRAPRGALLTPERPIHLEADRVAGLILERFAWG